MKKTFTVGIAGGSGSGKSTFSTELLKKCNGYNVKLIRMDDFFKPEEDLPTVQAFLSKETTYRDYNHPDSFFIEDFIEEVISCSKGSTEYDIVIIEGLFVLWDERILDMLDLKIFIDCNGDERIVRRIKRNMTYGFSMEEITKVYLDIVRYRHNEYVEPTKWRADIIINGAAPFNRALEVIKSHITESLNVAK